MSKAQLKVWLLSYPKDGLAVCNIASKTCYSAKQMEELIDRPSAKMSMSLQSAIDGGHLSVLEHMNFTFAVSGVSRTLLAQITRHRIASFSVQSQRYVSMGAGFDYVVPPSIEALGEEAAAEFARQMETMGTWYEAWQERLGNAGERSNEDARFVLPNACATRMLLTMNARELLHFFELRCCSRAQWEIRALADEMLRQAKEVAPLLFEKAGASCVATGRCPEGAMTCGRLAEMLRRAREGEET